MLKWMFLGMAVAGLHKCDGKHETSAPHATVTVDVAGRGTRALPATEFADGWAVEYDMFRLAPTFGIDDIARNYKDDGYQPSIGADAYLYGGTNLDLTSDGVVPEMEGWVLAGPSSGWGMKLRRVPGQYLDLPMDASLAVSGTATGPIGETLRFDWQFQDELVFAHCVARRGEPLTLPDGGRLDVHAQIDGAALFGESLAADAPRRFEPLTRADRDGDERITVAELRATPLSDVQTDSDAYRAPGAASLFDFLRARLVNLVAPSYTCEVSAAACQDRLLTSTMCERGDQADKDLDGDGSRNCLDFDVDGDGIENSQDCDPFTVLAALSQCDGSDHADKDTDADGARNCEDPDIDGDGFANEHDGRPYDNAYETAQTP